LGELLPGHPVNLERPVTLVARLGGHLVQGHVDGVGEVVGLTPDAEGGGSRLRVRLPAELLRYVVEKGSLAIDGVSLTVAELHDDGVSIAVIPHTLAVTTLGSVGRGDPVNVEVDLIAKYAERLIEGTDGRGPDE
jgi:riboflavin synthase